MPEVVFAKGKTPAQVAEIAGRLAERAPNVLVTRADEATAACVRETLALVAVGCQIVRITAPTVKDAANLRNIVAELRSRGCLVPIVADIHFKPEAAL